MNYDEWKLMNARAMRVIDEYAAAGICVPSGRRNAEALTTLQRVDYLQNRARATDAAPEDEERPRRTVTLVDDGSWAEEDARRQARRAKVRAVIDSYKRRFETKPSQQRRRRRRVACDVEPVGLTARPMPPMQRQAH
jgi:hypothetical protein